MCGICGIAYSRPERPVEPERLRAMQSAIAHRGPDGEGEWRASGVALGHRRLSVIDPQGGRQPLSNEDGSVWVAFNGEIYNFRELRQRLTALGHRFRTRSDTEVLVHGYEQWGEDVGRHLNGMFSFALYDAKRRRLLLVRDPLGIKPLFYSVTGEGLFFASEIKAVLAGSGRPAALSREGVQEYLIFRYAAGSGSMFEGVRRLPPGHLAVWEEGELRLRRYWSLPVPDGGAPSLDEAAEALDGRLDAAVESQLVSDVPLGAFCSGGVDSGLVTGYAARRTLHRLQTFSVGFEDPEWDETALARDTAARFGTDHHVLVARPDAFRSALRRLVWHHDEPLSHPNAVPLFLLSEFARRQVTVVLTGEGADELFGGYPRYHIARARAGVDALPAWALRGVAGAVRRLPGHRAAKLADLLPRSSDDSLLLNSAYVSPELVGALTGSPVDDALAERRRLVREARVPGDAVASLLRYELLTYLGCALDRMDRMSMATGLEARVPFLDLPLVEWGVQLASGLKMAGRQNKRVVKRVAQRMLSPRVTGGPKSGFGLPLAAWFRGPVLADLLSRMRDPGHPAAEHFDRALLGRLVDEHRGGAADHSELLWLVANVFLWYEVNRPGEAGSDERQWAAPPAQPASAPAA